MPQRLLILGGGIIGLEMATVYHELGAKVTIAELMDQLIPGTDKDLISPLAKRVTRQYENIYLKTKVTNVEARPEGLVVSFDGPKAPATDTFDRMLVAVGRSPNGKLIGAEKAGVTVDDRGFIAVDKQLRTNVPHIFAIGDVIGQPMLAHKAMHEGKVAAEVAAGKNSFFDARAIPSVAYTDPEVAWAGVTETEARAAGVTYGKGVFPWAASGRSLTLAGRRFWRVFGDIWGILGDFGRVWAHRFLGLWARVLVRAGLRVERGIVNGRGASRPVVQVTKRGMRCKARRRVSCAGHEVGKCTWIIVFISTTRAAILMRRRRKVSNWATRHIERFGIDTGEGPTSANKRRRGGRDGTDWRSPPGSFDPGGRAIRRQMRLPGLDVIFGLAASAIEVFVHARALRFCKLVTTKRVSGPSSPTSTRAMIRSTRLQLCAPSKNSLKRRDSLPSRGAASNRAFVPASRSAT